MPTNMCSLFRMQAECILPAYAEVEPHVSYGQVTARVNLGDTCVYDGDESRHNVRSCETHWVVFMQLMRKMLLQVGRLLLVLLWVHPWHHLGMALLMWQLLLLPLQAWLCLVLLLRLLLLQFLALLLLYRCRPGRLQYAHSFMLQHQHPSCTLSGGACKNPNRQIASVAGIWLGKLFRAWHEQ